ncbi:MAG: hypothetical protein CME25_14655 [Gemmatimonadetes bacterium]|nr:hypothetical protein [Gemmatimonadota bacterium]
MTKLSTASSWETQWQHLSLTSDSRLPATYPDSVDRLDFEGLTVDDDGNFFIASETTFRILRVSADGKDVRWITENLKRYGEEVGLFTKLGGYLEGIARRPGGDFVLAAESQARGIIEVGQGDSTLEVMAFNLDATSLPLKAPRASSFTGLFFGKGIACSRSTGAPRHSSSLGLEIGGAGRWIPGLTGRSSIEMS